MLSTHQRYLIADRCWLIYDLITNTFSVLDSFHLEFPEIVEVALASGYIEIRVQIEREHLLYIYEEYSFQAHTIVRVSYSYNLLDASQNNIIRADDVPHHRVDYRNQMLSHFPNHLHDEKGRICSFTGEIADFFHQVKRFL
ncbi:hypothetical protein FJZ31_36925 [Candidatus Poribacteria bacterium]|nr:hypothetical protein [Candidatus Poribacteria bacterium]